ncbi:type VI secretion system protein ImpL [Pseudoalteromonas citrea]|uniref:Type VI secretion system protein ImpL n=2 Tax=Pseudoalteromonas citrea TaxID=43655 RepID=A0AAD4AH77_9GAMM|nr:type VI secretion system membrane subunit TssM [Pseudoalteromonas citrea]KAF7769677.1 type VI secretion system protein ImpL [Pseudoalteromonas citrea]
MVGSTSKSGLVHFTLGLLSSRATGQLIGLIAILTIVWFAGIYIGLDSVNKRLIAMAVVFVSFTIFIFFRWIWTRRSGEKLASELAGHNAGSEAEIDEIKTKMEEALASLKASHLGAGYRGATALYALPWYMIIGPSAAGKSTLFANSGLHFPYSKSNQVHIQGFGGTRNCDWWFSDQAVLIDTAGRYTTEQSENTQWLSFLALLKKYRPKVPINGVMVAISIADILTADSEQIRAHVKLVRERIEELINELGVIFPVHIVFTKTDLISGFEPFFSDLDPQQREQVFGTYLLDLSEDQQADAAQLFEQRMEALYERLCEQRITKVARERNEQRKQLIVDFPNQFCAATIKLTEFINLLFKQNPYQEVPWFAGVYFTSGTQEGTPIERITSGTLAKFRSVIFEQKQEKITQAFFINRVFNDVVFRLQDLTRGNRKRRIFQRWIKALTVSGSLAGIAGVVALLFTSYTSNNLLLSQGDELVDAVVTARVERHESAVQFDVTLGLLSHYQQLLAYEESLPWHFIFGIYEGDETLQHIESILKLQVETLIAKPFSRENRLALEGFHQRWTGITEQQKTAKIRTQYYEALKLHLMMSSEFVAHLDSEFVRQQFLSKLGVQLNIDIDDETNSELVTKLSQLIDFYVDRIDASGSPEQLLPLWQENPLFIARGRAALATQPEALALYTQMKQQFMVKHEPIKLDAMLSPKNRSFISAAASVPYIFSANGWQELMYPEINRAAKLAYSGDWVMGTQINDDSNLVGGEVDEAKAGALIKSIRALYFQEYANQWFTFLGSITLSDLKSINNASLVLSRLSSNDGPLVNLMDSVSDNLQLPDKPLAQASKLDAADELINKAMPKASGLAQVSVVRVPELEHRFADLRRYSTPVENAKLSDYLQQYLGSLSAFHSELKKIAASNEDDQVAMNFVQDLLAGSQKDNALQSSWIIVESQVRALDPDTKQVLETLFKAPLTASVEAIMNEAKGQINSQWENQVYLVYKDNLRGKYPFNMTGPDAAVEDVSEFLNTQSGTLWRFVNEYLSPFITLKRGKWVEKKWNGIGLKFDSKVLKNLTTANKVTRSLFPKNSSELGIKFQMMPVAQRGIRETYFGFSDQAYRYRNEPEEWRKFSWPGQGGTEKATVYGLDSTGRRLSAEKSGPWALLKVLNDANVRWVKGSEFLATWQFEDESEQSPIKVQMALKSNRNSGVFSKYTLNAFVLPRQLFSEHLVIANSADAQLH